MKSSIDKIRSLAREMTIKSKLWFQGFVNQRENKIRASSSCNTSAICNAFWRATQPILWAVEGERPADTLSRELSEPWAWAKMRKLYPGARANPWNFSEIIVEATNKLQGRKIATRKVSTLNALHRDLENNVVCIGGVFSGLRHIICIYGVEGTNFLCDDSWGNALTGYKDHSGESVRYPIQYVNKSTFNGGKHPYVIIPRA
jgi:hypothetical protein